MRNLTYPRPSKVGWRHITSTHLKFSLANPPTAKNINRGGYPITNPASINCSVTPTHPTQHPLPFATYPTSPGNSRYNFLMAAIDLTRLNKQIEALKEVFSQPKEFRQRFHETLQFYHRYAHRQHKDAVPVSFMRVYDLPDQVLPQLANGLSLKARQDANETLAVVDELWGDDYYEARDLAAHLLGQIPLAAKANVLERISQWSSVPMDRAVVNSVFSKDSQRMRT